MTSRRTLEVDSATVRSTVSVFDSFYGQLGGTVGEPEGCAASERGVGPVERGLGVATSGVVAANQQTVLTTIDIY